MTGLHSPLVHFPAAAAAALVLLAPSQASAAPATHRVIVERMNFGPMPASVRAGDVIVWVNRDAVRHSATTRGPGFDVDLPPRAIARSTVPRAGTFAIVCKYHLGMTANLKVSK